MGEEPVRGRAAHRRRLAVLALLATAPSRGLARERIAAYLWPDADGRRNLSEALYQLKRELGDDAIRAVGDMLELDHRVVPSDAAAFRAAIDEERWEDAVAHYSAPFLDAWYVEDAPDFERWASEMRDDLASEYRQALSQLAARAESSAAWPDAAHWLGRLAREDPHSARVVMRFAKALEASGERAAAIQALAAHESALQRDLELPVSEDVAQFAAELKAAQPVTGPIVPRQPSAGPDVEFPVPGTGSRRRMTRRYALSAFAGALVLVAVMRMWPAQQASEAERQYDPHHVAVLYFDDHTAGKEVEHIADGLTEELIHQLAQVPTLRVVSRNGVKRFRDAPVTPDSLAAALRAGTLVEGSVQRSGDSLRVTVQLIDGNTGLHLASQVFERPAMELFAIEQDMAMSVSIMLRRHLGEALEFQSLGRGTRNSEAIDLVLRARSLRSDAARVALHPHEADVRSARSMLLRADSMLQLAARRDAAWTRPQLERGWLQLQLARLADAGDVHAHRTAEELAEKVVRREPGNAEAYQLRGTARWRAMSGPMQLSADSELGTRAEADLRKALALDSTLATAWATLADIVSVRGALAEAETAAERAVEQDAWLEGADETYFFGFAANLLLQRYGKAQRWCAQGQRAFPESWRFYECELTLLRDNSAAAPDDKRAWQLVAIMDSLDPPAGAHEAGHGYSPMYRRAVAAAVSARAGDSVRARAEIERLRALVRYDSALALDLLYDEAYVSYLLGERGRANSLLGSLFKARPMLKDQYARQPLLRWLSDARTAAEK